MQSLTLESLPNTAPDPSNAFWNDPAAVALGFKLFNDTRISANGKVACVTCHQPELAFTDGIATAQGISSGRRNTPSLIGISLSRRFNWDGSIDSLWAQAIGPIEAPAEMGFSRGQLVTLIASDKTLRSEYEQVFGPLNNDVLAQFSDSPCGPVSLDPAAQQCWNGKSIPIQQQATRLLVNLTKALAAFQSTLTPEPSRFDRFVKALASGSVKIN